MLSVKELKLSLKFSLNLKMLLLGDSRGDEEASLSLLPLREERAGWGRGSPGWRACSSSENREELYIGVCFTALLCVCLNPTTSDGPLVQAFRRSSSPKVSFKIPEFLLLSSSKSTEAASVL